MNPGGLAVRRGEIYRLLGDISVLLALAIVLGIFANLTRPSSARLPWVGDWKHHIEHRAFRAGVPVVFLPGVRVRLQDSATVVLDAREPENYEAGHLPGALSLPVGQAEERLGDYAALLTPQTPLLLYCDGADCADALELALKLREYGFEDVTLYPGGYAEWTEYGGRVARGGEP